MGPLLPLSQPPQVGRSSVSAANAPHCLHRCCCSLELSYDALPRGLRCMVPQALSKRIHYGVFVAEAKFLESPETFIPLIEAQVWSSLEASPGAMPPFSPLVPCLGFRV